MANPKKSIDPVFAEYQRTAPRLDLAFYLASIGSPHNIARPDRFGTDTPDIIRDMVLAYMDLTASPKPGSVAAQRRRVMELRARYQASRPRDWSVGSDVEPEPVEPAPVVEPETWWPSTLTDDQLMENALIAAANGRAIVASRQDVEPDADAERMSDLTMPGDPAWNGLADDGEAVAF